MAKNKLTDKQVHELINVLQTRFEKNKTRHPSVTWATVLAKLEANENACWSLYQMEQSGGEPDVVEFGKNKNEFIFCDCSIESPPGRRSYCYDKQALDARKENKPKNSAIEAAAEMGITLLDEAMYRALQAFGQYDTKTSSWIQTPTEIRKLGGALFCDRRYNTVFLYHNGAESYYAARGFRGYLVVK